MGTPIAGTMCMQVPGMVGMVTDPSMMMASAVPPPPPHQLLGLEHATTAGAVVLKDKLDQCQKPLPMKRVIKKCEHNRQRSQCKDCHGSGICEHNRQRRLCIDCGGAGLRPLWASWAVLVHSDACEMPAQPDVCRLIVSCLRRRTARLAFCSDLRSND